MFVGNAEQQKGNRTTLDEQRATRAEQRPTSDTSKKAAETAVTDECDADEENDEDEEQVCWDTAHSQAADENCTHRVLLVSVD